MTKIQLHYISLLKIFVPLMVLILQTSIPQANAETIVTNFSADNVAINTAGQQTTVGKLYVSDDAIRVDGLPSMGMLKGVKLNLSILLLKKYGMQYIYNHDNKRVYISSISKSIFTGDYKSMGDITVGKTIASEQVSGYLTNKKPMLINYYIAEQTITTNMFVWESSRFNFPLKLMDEDGNIQVLRNIKLAKPAANIFVPMQGYQVVDSLIGVLGLDFSHLMSTLNLKHIQNIDVSNLMQSMNNNITKEQKANISQLLQQTMTTFQQSETIETK